MQPWRRLIFAASVPIAAPCSPVIYSPLWPGRNRWPFFVGQAIENGAAAILTQEPMVAGVPVVTSDNPRRDLALMAARFFEVQPPHIAAITGTNGKTSSAVFLRQLFAAANYKAASLGTLGIDMGAWDY